ncbi:MAG: ABC transporter ATP-binding protein [Rhodospirillaceae bacterium]|nr:ABC transporter ATP-binding protein [Rhodospirillaceae bacterium]
MIELSAVTKAYNQGRENEFWALRGIDLTLERGKATVFQGPSGSGKTTLLTLVGCLARPTSGRVRFKGRDISALPERFLTDIRRDAIGFVFQSFNLIRGVSAVENVMIPAYPLGRPPAELEARAHALLNRLGVGAKASSPSERLSGGEAQRVAIARALINDPELIVADEPTANLDSGHSARFLEIAEGLKAEGRTLLIASHDPRVIDAAPIDRIVALRDGRILDAG